MSLHFLLLYYRNLELSNEIIHASIIFVNDCLISKHSLTIPCEVIACAALVFAEKSFEIIENRSLNFKSIPFLASAGIEENLVDQKRSSSLSLSSSSSPFSDVLLSRSKPATPAVEKVDGTVEDVKTKAWKYSRMLDVRTGDVLDCIDWMLDRYSENM